VAVRRVEDWPWSTLPVRMSGGDRISASVGPDDKGRFRIAELPAGTWTVTLRGPDGLRALHESQVTLKPGQTSELTVDMEKE
jgi:hypothetical protein